MSNRLSRNCPDYQMCLECQKIAKGYDDRRSGTVSKLILSVAGVFALITFGYIVH